VGRQQIVNKLLSVTLTLEEGDTGLVHDTLSGFKLILKSVHISES